MIRPFRTTSLAVAFTVAAVISSSPVTAGAGTAPARPAKPTTVAVIGDVPYGIDQEARFGELAIAVNADPKVRLAMHVGDIKSGSTTCTDERFAAVRSTFDTFEDPLVYTPGDNEWTDCHRTNNGGYNPLARLDAVRSTFFPEPGSTIGARQKRVRYQRALVENVRWIKAQVSFATLHVVGSDNGLAPWLGVGHATPTPEQVAEVDARIAAALAWIDATFDEAQAAGLRGVVLAMQADTWDPVPSTRQQAIVDRIAARTAAFDGRVLLLQGDSHEFVADNPLGLANFTRIVVHGETLPFEYLRLTVDPRTAQLFSWVRVPVPGPTINGGGSSFAGLEIDQWRADVARPPFNLRINYQSLGSTLGRVQYPEGTLDFGVSDIPFQPGELRGPRTNFVYVPVSAGGIGFMYNLQDSSGRKVTDLKLTRRAVCRIFTEPDMKWNDPDIVAHNPGLSGVSREIRPVVRSDAAGTSYGLSEFCLAVVPDVWFAFIERMRAIDEGVLSPDFKDGRPVSNWPIGWGRVSSALAADGVANAVADPVNGRDAITYNEAGFAKERGLPNASVQNAGGRFTAPEEEAVTVALGYASPNTPGGQEDGTFSLNYTGSDPRAYFPSTYSYAIAQTDGFAPDKGLVLSRFLCYAVTKGQEIAVSLQYARLSSVLVELALRQISKVPGFPGLDQCAVAGAAAPPPAGQRSSPTSTKMGLE